MAKRGKYETTGTLLAVRRALDPTPAQERALRSHAGAARVAFNWGLAQVKANLGQREAERSYGIPDDQLTPSLSWSLYSLRKAWNAAKEQVTAVVDPVTGEGSGSWWREVSKEAFTTGLASLVNALENWSASKRGDRKGRAMGFPTLRSKRKARQSVRFTTGAIRCETTHAVLPRLGRVKLHERTDLAGARVLSATVRYERGRWFVAFQVEHPHPVILPAPAQPDAVVGVDLGIKTLAVLSGGRGEVPNPKHLTGAQRHLRRLARRLSRRRGPDRRTRQRPSKRWQRASDALGKVHGRVRDLRRDAQHKLTTGLTATYGTIVVEDLNVAGMVMNRRLARAISDAGFGEIRRQIEDKAAWRGGRVIVADRWFASSKTCSGCGAVRAKLLLSERTYGCGACGLVCDRDVNAADNLEQYGIAVISGSGSEMDGRGADHKTGHARQVAVKRQPGGSAPADRETGTLPPQGESAA